MIDRFGVQYENLLGIDISESMIHVASQRIRAQIGNVLEIDSALQTWNLAFCGLNIFNIYHTSILQKPFTGLRPW